MQLEDLKQEFCQDKNNIEKLSNKIENITREIKTKIIEIKNTKEYSEYQNNPNNEQLRLKLIKIKPFEEFIFLKNKLDDLKKEYNIEINKVDEKDFNRINNKLSCKHLFYSKSEDEKICVKCCFNTKKDQKYLKASNNKELNYSYLIINLKEYYSKDRNKNMILPKMFDNESFEYLEKLTKEIMSKNKDLTNKQLLDKLKKEVAIYNVSALESIYGMESKMNSEIKRNYKAYKKILQIR